MAKLVKTRARALWLLLALLLCKPLAQAFCNTLGRVRSRVPRAAEDAKAKSPVRELEQKLTKVLGRKPKKDDMVWRFEASLDLPCLTNLSSTVERVTISSGDINECKRKAAAVVLASLDFDDLATKAGKVAQVEKESKKPLKGLEVGANLTLNVTRRTQTGLRLDWAGKEVTLPASELREGFPLEVPGRGAMLKVRVLATERTTLVTMRKGSLERPEKVKVKLNVSALDGYDGKFEAEVVDFNWREALMKVTSPDGSETLAHLPKQDFAEGLEKELMIGSKIHVRKKYAQKDRLVVSMREPPTRTPSDLEVGEALTGRLEGIQRLGERPAAFLDVGFDRPAYLDWQEVSDSLMAKTFARLRTGSEVSCRVLKVDGDRIYVTSRSGDLYRPTFQERPPQAVEEVVEKFRALPKDQWLEARVLRIFPKYALVVVKTPDGTEAEGYVPRGYWSEDFLLNPVLNGEMKVRCLPELPKARGRRSRVMLTMKELVQEEQEVEVEEVEPVETTTSAPDRGPLSGLQDLLMR